MRRVAPRFGVKAKKMRPLLAREILREAGFAAPELYYDFMTEGVPMFGEFPKTGVFEEKIHEARLSLDELKNMAKWAMPVLEAAARTRPEKEVEDELWKATMEEVRLKEARGPFTKEEMDRKFPDGWLGARRFPVVQKKVRPCDDYSQFGQNATSETSETVNPDGPDMIVGVARLWVAA